MTELKEQIEKFWLLEDTTAIQHKSSESLIEECENHYIHNISRNDEGRYIVGLPFRISHRNFGNTHTMALRRFHGLQRKFNSDPSFKNEYEKVINDYLESGHVYLKTNKEEDGCYLPHHAVKKDTSETRKLRVVFDASAKGSRGISLNDSLMIGPTIQDTLFEHLVRFRTYKYVLIADIEKMYRQVLIHPKDRKYQQILWYNRGEISTYQLNTVTFGISSAPFLAIRTLHQLANDEQRRFPLGSKILKKHLYWASNEPKALIDLHERVIDVDFLVNPNSTFKTLGVSWNAQYDKIFYTFESNVTLERVTKRQIFSKITKIFDPLQLIGPIVFAAKVMMQSQLPLINELKVNRRLMINEAVRIELHGFCDASKLGYGACLYIRSCDGRNKTLVNLLCAKSRVAPMKEITIPRLELCGALTLTRLYREVQPMLDVQIDRIIFWSDSTIVLHWLKKPTQELKVFEANRVAEIQTLRDKNIEWRHVCTNQNPADAISRGQSPKEFIKNRMWFEGPDWLKNREESWPVTSITSNIELPGLRKPACLVASANTNDIFLRFSSYSRLVRVIAYCMRILPTCKNKGLLTIDEINAAERRIIRMIQADQFAEVIDRLTNSKGVKGTKFLLLCPFINSGNILCVGGRLRNADIPLSQKYSILLPTYHHVTDLIIRETHEKSYHAGIQSTLYTLRSRFWLFNGKNQVRKIIRHCIRCIRYKVTPVEYRMADLPKSRLANTFSSQHTGVDYFCPMFIKEKKFRNKGEIKTYGCVFICMTTKAVHIEIVTEMTTEAFLAALRRFISRRAIPTDMYSDNGTKFVGANRQLRDLYALIESNNFKETIYDFSVSRKIKWHFNPPLSPHF
ncbi:uncharacterized protein [Prorops nasuta]|uniref:uncharacterized protein n=1 Tax=Prorops nasuta TaxID=863751 RepID=UPI0034CF9851